MYVITCTFETEVALAKVSELLSLGDSPERLAERLGQERDLESIKEGIKAVSFQRVLTDLAKLRQFLEIEKHIEEVQTDKSMLRFLGSGFKEKQLAKLQDERRKFGSLIEAPRWFYKQERVRLLSAIRDYALDSSQQGDAAWSDVAEKSLVFPVAEMFEAADLEWGQDMVEELEKPLTDVSPQFILEHFEGHRSINFDFTSHIATYYTAAPREA